MILRKYFSLFLTIVIVLVSLDLIFSRGEAEENKTSATCEITYININCINLRPDEAFKINLLSEPYRIKIVFENKIKIKKNKNYNSEFITSVRSNKFSKSNTKLVIEFKKPTIISNIKYFKKKTQNVRF